MGTSHTLDVSVFTFVAIHRNVGIKKYIPAYLKQLKFDTACKINENIMALNAVAPESTLVYTGSSK